MSIEKSILIIGCFDTKNEAFSYLVNQVQQSGARVITINTGVLGTTSNFSVNFESEAVAAAAGEHIDTLRARKDRGYAMEVMGKGAGAIVGKLVAEGKISGAIGMGGGGGTYVAIAAMGAIPLGIPKICISTLATKDLSRQIGHKDITLIPSVVDVAGLNSILKTLIAQAAVAITAMSQAAETYRLEAKGNIAISMFGNTTACVDRCTELLREHGYQVLAFHANGVGGLAMEALIREGCVEAVLDITTTELADELCGGICSAGPGRLTAAAETGIPQVIVPGCLDMVNFGHLDTVPGQFANRKLYSWAPDVTLMRTSIEENEILGKELTVKAGRSNAPVEFVFPAKGLSQIGAPGGIFFDPAADAALLHAIQQHSNEHTPIFISDTNINDPAFADQLVERLLKMLK